VLTGLLAPWVTSRWEERDKKVAERRAVSERQLEARAASRQRETEVKSAIVKSIGTSTAIFLSAIEVGAIDRSRLEEASAEYRTLKTASLEIGSQLAAYFPNSLPVVRWRDYSFSLRNLYLVLTSKNTGRARNPWLDDLNRHLDQTPGQYDGLCLEKGRARYDQDLREIVLALQKREEQIVRAVVASNTILTGTPTPDVSVKRHNYKAGQKPACD
jgi:hypothetical protein